MAQSEEDDIILISKDDVTKLGLSVLYLTRELKKAYHGEWGGYDYTKEEFTENPELAAKVKRINSEQLAVRVGDVRVDVAGNVVGKIVPYGNPAMIKNVRRAMVSKKGIRVIPRLGWGRQIGTIGARYVTPYVITFDVGFK